MKFKMTMGAKTSNLWNKGLCVLLAISLVAGSVMIPKEADAAAYTNDTFSNKQWAYYGQYNIGIEEAWALGTGMNNEVIVAVIDVGVDNNHEDLFSVMWINAEEIPDDGEDNDENGYKDDIYGYNFFDENGLVCNYAYSETEKQYVEDHGTHIAGIIAAVADNGMGIAGVASRSNVKIMALKVLGDEQDGQGIKGNTNALIEAIKYAEANGATICNMSLGYEGMNKQLYEVMKSSNMLFVCAAGNGVQSTNGYGWNVDEKPEYPAAFDLDNIISVANMNERGYIDKSSCYGANSVDIGAPGTNIASTVVMPSDTTHRSSKYMLLTGTSMAAPMVTGTAAILASYYNDLTNFEIKEAILNGAVINPNFAGKVAGGRMLNVEGALNYYKNAAVIETTIEAEAVDSNNKRIIVDISHNGSPVVAAAYTQGEQPSEYFVGGMEGTSLEWSENRTNFVVNQTGNYTIYLLCADGTELTKQISVEVPVVKKLKLSVNEKTLKKGSTYKLRATVKPMDMYVKLVYQSTNSKVAAVNADGKITAKTSGKAKIKVYAKDGNTKKKAVCKIVVTES